jgi:hippurate hydrolase
MAIINRIAEFQPEMAAWRRDIHKHPETAFEETRTADMVAAKLESFGIEVHRGLAGTGVVGTLEGIADGGHRAIGLRADLDALHIREANDFDHKSIDEGRHEGRMHACGHDGHTTMLLGAAKYLAETRNFGGTVRFIFQPAEENEGGGRVMVEEGLFDHFPVDAVYGLHNWPGAPVGSFAVRPGPMMAAFDIFEAKVKGKGSHAAMPHQGVDPVVTAAQMVSAWQTITSRNTNAFEAAVVSVTQIHAGDTWNVIPEEVVLRGTARTFKPEVQDEIEPAMRRIATGICQAMGAEFEMWYERRYPATVNSAAETEIAAAAAVDVVGLGNVDRDPTPTMGSEDFAFMLQARPGCYIWMGNGSDEGDRRLHSPHYDFNDEALPVGASYWARLVETVLVK